MDDQAQATDEVKVEDTTTTETEAPVEGETTEAPVTPEGEAVAEETPAEPDTNEAGEVPATE